MKEKDERRVERGSLYKRGGRVIKWFFFFVCFFFFPSTRRKGACGVGVIGDGGWVGEEISKVLDDLLDGTVDDGRITHHREQIRLVTEAQEVGGKDDSEVRRGHEVLVAVLGNFLHHRKQVLEQRVVGLGK